MPLSPAIADPDELGAALATQCFSQAKIPVDGKLGIEGEQTSCSFLMQPVSRAVTCMTAPFLNLCPSLVHYPRDSACSRRYLASLTICATAPYLAFFGVLFLRDD